MKVVVNALGYVGQNEGAGGAGVFLQYLISRLAEVCEVDVLVAPGSRSFRNGHRKARLIELPYLTPDTLRQLQSGPTVVLDPFGGLPCERFPEDLALCAVVHDLMHLERPNFFTRAERDARSIHFARGLQRADSVVTFSQDQARAIRKYYLGVQPVVIPHLPYMTLGIDPTATGDCSVPAGITRFVLFPGVKWPHKNHKTVIEAFDAYVKLTGSDLALVMCGAACGEHRFSFLPSRQDLCGRIVDLGLVSDEMLQLLFLKAEAILFPSLYEGFGIPVLEAAYQGKMVAASGLTVFDEILGPTGYRRVADPLCHVRWLAAFADIEDQGRQSYEPRAQSIIQRVDVSGFIGSFISVLKESAERYSHPGLYPQRRFPSGDRATSSVLAELSFADVYETAAVNRGARNAALGIVPGTQGSTIYRSTDAPEGGKQCLLRARYDIEATGHLAGVTSSLQFSSWLRLLNHSNLDALRWSVNDQGISDILPLLNDGNWHLFRVGIPSAGYIDLRGVRGGQSEVAGFDIEIHNSCIVRSPDLACPLENRQAQRLTVVVAALTDRWLLDDVIRSVLAVNSAVPSADARIYWIIITRASTRSVEYPDAQLPSNLRVHVLMREEPSRNDATGLISPYEPVSKLLLLEAGDVPDCLDAANLATLVSALGPAPADSLGDLTLSNRPGNFWHKNERGRIMEVSHRAGEPIPLLDPAVIQAILDRPQSSLRPRFAVIETDRTRNISHHTVVSQLFLSGAKAMGFRPVLGLHGTDRARHTVNDVEVWTGFSAQVYSVGTADCFAVELGQFVEAVGLNRDDIVFLHSLSPQILLGAARFVAANPESAPSFAMRFFSTAEAMAGHRLSYVKVLRSIENVEIIRSKMHFFCESTNLVEYFKQRVGRTYPLLFNPEHPDLALVRDSDWFDPNLGDGKTPILAYLGEAREEKGFEDLPTIVGTLLESKSMTGVQFLLQTGSNAGNETAQIAHARAALAALKAKYPGRIRTVDSVETPEQFYFLMKHARAVIAPYKPSAYGKRGSGVILEALQMGLEVFVWADTDLYATFRDSGQVIGVKSDASFSNSIIEYYETNEPRSRSPAGLALSQSPETVCKRLLSLCARETSPRSTKAEAILWVGNDTFGEGCSAVYASQKVALQSRGRDCFEIFVPWPDVNWKGVSPGVYDEKIYGFTDGCESTGIAWAAQPTYSVEMCSILREIQESGPSYGRLRKLNSHFMLSEMAKKAIANNVVRHTLLNYAHLYPVIEELVPLDRVICETHDINAYQHAVRRGGSISLAEKIEEFADLAKFRHIIAISADEEREISGACPTSRVHWRLPPFIPELPTGVISNAAEARATPLQTGRSIEASKVLNTVLESGPITGVGQDLDLEALANRLVDVERIDLVLVGSGHPSNVKSFRWFIEEVYLKYFSVRGRNLFVVGSVCDALATITNRSLFKLGRCAHLRPILTASRACPLPVIVGSGAAIKAIPALALNGAVTVTDHIERAFKLRDYGIPSFSEPGDFADDLWTLLVDDACWNDRRSRASRYAAANLSLEGYVQFWESLLSPVCA